MQAPLTYTPGKLLAVEVPDDMFIVMENIDNDTARIYVLDNIGGVMGHVKSPFPASRIKLVNGNHAVVPLRNNEYIITWVQSYTLFVDNKKALELCTMKQQSVVTYTLHLQH